MNNLSKITFIIRLFFTFSILLSPFLPIESAQFSPLDTKKAPLISFQKQACEVDHIDHEVIIYCTLRVILNTSLTASSQKDLYLKEEEVEGEAYGDYIEQTISPISNRPNLYHNPYPLPIKVHNLTDQVMTMINLKRPHQNGSIKWSIPTILQKKSGEIINQFPIIQEFLIEENILTLKKGGLTLIKLNLEEYSKPINNLP